MRFITVVLLMAVFFLLGIVYANNPSGEMFGGWKEALEQNHEAEDIPPVQKEPKTEPTSVLEPVDVEQSPTSRKKWHRPLKQS
ncbi:hypothetical protein JNUCC1_03459 [Lentibacillus sp. JNUCC-1]|uniref:hypothetical protein n=1 Tax=Lentibacillus sp. JNUCC-1 TaxID=2654513 RepID=UPI0012E71825|nr:hypothetical protein [Lentibacillus sp. JNUCC-1]MUV39581.1 hypothetical protein [Lentibacillus sp. JNUCC-1]